jgi:hypothetical protein
MRTTIADLGADDFEPHAGEVFRLTAQDRALDLELAQVQRLGDAMRSGGAFSLVFYAPAGPVLPQSIYPIAHPALGMLELFIVPIQPANGKQRYEVIFT